MNDGLKQRIIGALVLVALGIIFIPVIFDKERIVPVDRTTQVPPEPDIVKNPPKSLSQTDSTLQAWVLQVASYKNTQRAEELRQTLVSKGQQAFVKTINTPDGDRTRLYIGPTINKADLEKTKVDIDRRYGVDSIISRFKP